MRSSPVSLPSGASSSARAPVSGVHGIPIGDVPVATSAGRTEEARASGGTRVAGAVARVAALFALAIIFLLCLELTARIEDWVRYRTPIATRITSQTDLLVRDTAGVHGRPGARYQKWALNSLGFRGPELRVRESTMLRVVTAGASETFGLYESPGREYPRQLEDSLGARLAVRASCARTGSGRVEVINAALPGMSLPTATRDIDVRLRSFRPDVVVLYPTPVQYLDFALPRPAQPDTSPGAGLLPRARSLHSRSLARLKSQLKTLVPDAVARELRLRRTASRLRDKAPGWRFERIPMNRLAQFERDLEVAVRAVHAIGARPLLVTHGNAFAAGTGNADLLAEWEQFYPRATGTTIIAFDSAARVATLAVARRSGAGVIDLLYRLPRNERDVFEDYAHFTDRGAGLIAGAIAREIEAQLRMDGWCGEREGSS